MADYNSGLPIRSEADGTDEKVIVKVIDGQPGGSNQMQVDADKNAHVEMHGNDPAGLDRVLRLSELGAMTPDGVYNATSNTKPGTSAVILHSRTASPNETHQTFRPTGIASTDGSNAKAMDVALRDESGNAFTVNNPLPVTFTDSEGTEINQLTTSTAVAVGASVNVDYTVTALNTFYLAQIVASGSGKILAEVKLETAAGSGSFTTIWRLRNSTAQPNIFLTLSEQSKQVAGAKVRVTVTNKDNQAQDIDVTISGHEV